MDPQYLDDLAALNKDGGDYIRLLRVHTPSSRPKEAILCELRVFSLRHAPRYSALSYCRQPESRIVNIDIRGSVKPSFQISHDLRAAMRAVHHHRRSDWFWIDAICINQASDDEKNDQVRRMRDIYETAYAGLIWLGTAVPRDWLVHSEDNQASCLLDDKFVPKIGSREVHHAKLGFTHGKVIQLARLSQNHRAWWHRTWIIQEMVLPARLYVCVGWQIMRWDQLVSVCDDWGLDSPDYDYRSVLKKSTAKLKKLDELRTRWQSAAYSLDLSELLRLGLESYATDARDNVYGILGLMSPQDKQHIRVDYSRTVEQVYAEATALLIDKQQSLDLIVGSFWHMTETSQACLPSWVVDFGAGPYDPSRMIHESNILIIHERSTLPLEIVNWFKYNAGGRSTPCVSIDDHSLELHLEAVLLDRVVETLESDEALSEEYRPTHEILIHRLKSENVKARPIPQWLRSWLLSAIRLIQPYAEREHRPADPQQIRQRKAVMDFLTQAACCTRNHFCWGDGPYSTEERNAMLHDIVLNSEGLDDDAVRKQLSNNHADYDWSMMSIEMSARESLFATEHGLVGWARYDPRQSAHKPGPFPGHSVRKDDMIVVPRGASMPWVLRETNVKGEYKLIIDCFVDGVMNGELMSLVESGELQTQRYTLV